MQFRKFKKYITWNIISGLGYIELMMTIIFLIMYILASSNMNMRSDLNEFYADYISKYVMRPYIDFYKFHLVVIFLVLIGFIKEYKYYNENNLPGLQLFENHPKMYSFLFYTGLICNILPLNVVFIILISSALKFLQAMI